MGLYRKYTEQSSFNKKMKRPSHITDTTISNMMGYSGNGNTNMDNTDYGKIKSKGGLVKNDPPCNSCKKSKSKSKTKKK